MSDVLDLCAGGLGQHLAAKLLGLSTVAVVERDPWCLSVAEARVPSAERFDDVNTFPAKRFTGIPWMLAGWPCQPHSDAGLKLGAADGRDLLDGLLRALRVVRPECALLENVPAVLRTDGGRYFRRLLDHLADLGYDAQWGVLGALHVGAPHRRLRLFILAYRVRGQLEGYAQRDLGAIARAVEAPRRDDAGGRSDDRSESRAIAGPDHDGSAAHDDPRLPWATPCAHDYTGSLTKGRLRTDGEEYHTKLAAQVARDGSRFSTWSTPCARDHRNGASDPASRAQRDCGGPPLTEQVGALLNPPWVAALMGWPMDWLDLSKPGTDWPAMDDRGWPAPRLVDGPSPQWAWEPSRQAAPRVVRNRCAQIRALGNGWVPQAAAVAVHVLARRALESTPARQEVLFT